MAPTSGRVMSGTSWTFTAPKQVVLRHRTPAAIYYACVLATLTYVLAYQIIYKGGYKAFHTLQGVARVSYLPPAYTNQKLKPIEDMTYCAQAANSTNDALPCVTWDPSLTTVTNVDGGVLVGTRLKRSLQRRNLTCNELQYGCEPWYIEKSISVYTGDVESGTVLVQHSVTTSSPILATSSSSLDSFGNRQAAQLTGEGGTIDTIPCGDTRISNPLCGDARGDLFTLRDLLRAANLNLDSLSEGSTEKNETKRNSGVTLILTIIYNAGFGQDAYNYQVNASKLEAKSYFFGSFASTFGATNESSRELFDLHGVQITTSQAGGLTTFDFFTLLLTFVSGMALISLSRTVTEWWLLYLSPRRKEYRLFLQSHTPTFRGAFKQDMEENSVLKQLIERKRRRLQLVLGKDGALMHNAAQPSEQ